MIDTILFDLDDTLLDFQKAVEKSLSKTLIHYNIEPTESVIAMYKEISTKLYKDYEKGLISASDRRNMRYKLLFDKLNVNHSPSEAINYYNKQLAIGHYFVDSAEKVLKNLTGKYRLYIASNGYTNVQMSRIKSADIAQYFENIFISEAIGYEKPDINFFEKCFEKIDNLNKNKTVIIGDNLKADIKGGIQSGIKTIWYNPKKLSYGDIIPDYQIHSLSELPKLVSSM
ncbi:MAG: YjjG family noncanonical pyrimidine nucleotidase [Oscillospiraceae bacterium]|nr:YjjG family noncanonical pyrimidine nucleotidase [Oscillospiraceae bacterium]